MATSGGPNMERAGLVLSLDGASRRSTLKATQVNNILPDPGNWSTGTGGQTGYSPNGSTSEQNRVSVTDDPWGRTSITWRTTPDSTSGADGGWNSSYYPIDTNHTYRYSMWVRRYTSGLGGTFYMGLNPNPLRNDNDSSQSNPYFTYPSISTLTQNQWYLVVAHVFYEGYTGGRHPESGWYENGVKISDKSYGNIGAQDSRWASGTTTARHRAYHYYTTNVNSGIEFAYPRIDKIDGKEPSISELINRGESGWLDLSGGRVGELTNGIQYSLDGVQSSFNFDGTDDYMAFTDLLASESIGAGTQLTISLWLNCDTYSSKMPFSTGQTGNDRIYYWTANSLNTWRVGGYTSTTGHGSLPSVGNWFSTVLVIDGTNITVYLNGQEDYTGSYTGFTTADYATFGRHGATSSYYYDGKIANAKIYNRALSADEVQQNYNAYKNRFNL